MLVEGFIDSFVDFFYLTHRAPAGGRGGAEGSEAPPLDTMTFIKSHLTAAEEVGRRGDHVRVFEHYTELADHFFQGGDVKTAVYYYEKGADAATAAGDAACQSVACKKLGVAHESMGNVTSAIELLERHLALAQQLQDPQQVTSACFRLIEVYGTCARELEEKGDLEGALEVYSKSLQAAISAKDVRSQGLATHRLGLLYRRLGRPQEAVEHQKRYAELSKQLGDQQGEAAAYAALAESFQDMGDSSVAVEYLENFLAIASKNNQLVRALASDRPASISLPPPPSCVRMPRALLTLSQTSQYEACAALGAISARQGEHAKAVGFFEKMFETAKTIGDRRLVDAARVRLGVARGHVALDAYMSMVRSDEQALLRWKSKRVGLPGFAK